MRDWANREGYFYQGIGAPDGIQVFMFERPDAIGYAPVSSDTADEAINAIIGSTALYHHVIIVARKVNGEAQEKAYKEGFKDGAKYGSGGGEESYRRGYIEGSQLRNAGAPN
jgi:hypothetical protein